MFTQSGSDTQAYLQTDFETNFFELIEYNDRFIGSTTGVIMLLGDEQNIPQELNIGGGNWVEMINYEDALVVGGFHTPSNHIQQWDGAQWTSMGEGFNSAVRALAVYDNVLYAAGNFITSGTASLRGIAWWDGTDWQQVGSGLSLEPNAHVVNDLMVHQGKLYASGAFVGLGISGEPSYLATWNGSSWEQVQGITSTAHGMTVVNGELLVAVTTTGTAKKLYKVNGQQAEEFMDAEVAMGAAYVRLGNFNGRIWMTGFSNAGPLGNTKFIEIGGAEWKEFRDAEVIVRSIQKENTWFHAGRMGREQFYYTSPIFKSDDKPYGTELVSQGISARIDASGTFFTDQLTSLAGYKHLAYDSVSSIYAASLWVCATDTGSATKVAAQQWGNDNANLAWRFGPHTTSLDQDFVERYMRVWKVSAAEVTNHLSHFNDPDYIMPEALKYWPGNGRVDKGESQHLAPFTDTNANGWYEPHLGDYPDILGTETTLVLLHDHKSVDPGSGPKLNVVLRFHYDAGMPAEQGEYIRLQCHITNVSGQDYPFVRFGIWTDFDLGFGGDDYSGTHSPLNLVYAYQGDPLDEPSAGSPGFGTGFPAQGVVLLSDVLGGSMAMTAGSNPISGDPTTDIQYCGYLNDTWKNGQPLIFGGLGFEGAAGANPNVPTSFIYPSAPWLADSIAWSMPMAGLPPGDSRMVGRTEPFSLWAGESRCLDFVFIHAFSATTGAFEEVVNLFDMAAEALLAYTSGSSNCGPEIFQMQPNVKIQNINPGPTCAPAQMTFEVSHIAANPQEWTYEVSISDGSPLQTFTYEELINNPFLTHTFITNSQGYSSAGGTSDAFSITINALDSSGNVVLTSSVDPIYVGTPTNEITVQPLIEGQPMSDLMVTLFALDSPIAMMPGTSAQTNFEGIAQFYGLPVGGYLVAAVPNPAIPGQENYLTTYSNGAFSWPFAQIVYLGCQTQTALSFEIITLSSSNGPGTASGKVYYRDTGRSFVSDEPIPNVPVILEKASEDFGTQYDWFPLALSMTDVTGAYNFTDIPEGDYRLSVEIPGLPMAEYHFFTISTGSFVFTDLNFYADTTDSIYISDVVSLIEIPDAENLMLFPNPANSRLEILFETRNSVQTPPVCLDALGRTLPVQWLKTANGYRADIRDLPAGLFYLSVQLDNGFRTLKWVKEPE